MKKIITIIIAVLLLVSASFPAEVLVNNGRPAEYFEVFRNQTALVGLNKTYIFPLVSPHHRVCVYLVPTNYAEMAGDIAVDYDIYYTPDSRVTSLGQNGKWRIVPYIGTRRYVNVPDDPTGAPATIALDAPIASKVAVTLEMSDAAQNSVHIDMFAFESTNKNCGQTTLAENGNDATFEDLSVTSTIAVTGTGAISPPALNSNWNDPNIAVPAFEVKQGNYRNVGLKVTPANGGFAMASWNTAFYPEPMWYFGQSGEFESHAWITISGTWVSTAAMSRVKAPTAEQYMIGCWNDIYGPCVITRPNPVNGTYNRNYAAQDYAGNVVFNVEYDGQLTWGATSASAPSNGATQLDKDRNSYLARDAGISRAGAGVIQADGNGTAGNVAAGSGIFKASRFRATAAAPSASNEACVTGDIWIGTGYIYVCTATNTIKRATLATW